MIQRLVINKLFGIKDVKLKFNKDISILTGTNGSGKTTILNIINDIATSNYYNLSNYSFKKLTVTYDDETEVVATNSIVAGNTSLKVFLIKGNEKIEINLVDFNEIVEAIPISIWGTVEDDIGELEQINARTWRDIYTSERFSRSEIIKNYVNKATTLKNYIMANNLFKGLMPDVCKYIGINRLIRFENIRNRYREQERKVVNSIDLIAKQIKEEIINELAKYMSYSQNIDSSYPVRLIGKGNSNLDIEQLNNIINELDKLIEGLFNVGLIDSPKKKSLNVRDSFNEFEMRALFLYYKDLLEKFKYLLPLEEKLRIFKTKIDSKLKDKKTIEYSKEFGFKIFTKDKIKKEIPLNTLSSGEQHEIIMLYDLLFCPEEVKLYLIDEPEISLHLDWQREYLIDLFDIVNSKKNMQIIIATHAPAIIGDYLKKCLEI
jgi:predicted ATPase